MQYFIDVFSWDYSSLRYTPSVNQEQAFNILTMWKNVLLTGAAGSGKTFLINKFITFCHEHAITIAVTASTGIAATHIGGMTIHSWSGMGIRDTLTDNEIEDLISREYLVKRFVTTSVLIIDEISMLWGNFIASLDHLLQSARVSSEPFWGIQIIFVGDFFQLPPVSRWGEVYYAFEHRIWSSLNFTPCVLSTQYRQSGEGVSDALLTILDEIRHGDVSDASRELLFSRNILVHTDDHTELFTRNIAVDAYNSDRLEALPGEEYIYYMQSKWAEKFATALKKWCLAPEILILKRDARVMFVKNNPEVWYMNGSTGHIVDIRYGVPIVRLVDGREIIVETSDWMIEENGKIKASVTQMPLRLAWAITVHKSQGMTLDTAVMNLLDAFVPGQGYVALSRVRTLEGLVLHWFNRIALEIDPRVRAYDAIIGEQCLEVVRTLESMSEEEIIEQQEISIKKLWGVLESKKLPLETLKTGKKIATHLETYALLQQGMSLEEIASTRDLKPMTIFSHLEKLIDERKTIDLTPYRPADESRLTAIHDVFVSLATLQLGPVHQHLYDIYDEEYTFDELRIARLFLSEDDRLTIEAGK